MMPQHPHVSGHVCGNCDGFTRASPSPPAPATSTALAPRLRVNCPACKGTGTTRRPVLAHRRR